MDTCEKTDRFDHLVAAAETAAFHGWDFDYLNGRWHEETPPWSYRALVVEQLAIAQALLDMGTGGGEFLASLAPLLSDTVVTETYMPNIAVAQARLAPLGVSVVVPASDDTLPFSNKRFDLVINRHESFDANEVYRIIRPEGSFLTQQVGGRDNVQLNQLISAEAAHPYAVWELAVAHQQLVGAGFSIVTAYEAFPQTHFYDIGAVVYYLRAIPWQIPDFAVDRYQPALYHIHQTIQATGQLSVHSHRFFLHAQRLSVQVRDN